MKGNIPRGNCFSICCSRGGLGLLDENFFYFYVGSRMIPRFLLLHYMLLYILPLYFKYIIWFSFKIFFSRVLTRQNVFRSDLQFSACAVVSIGVYTALGQSNLLRVGVRSIRKFSPPMMIHFILLWSERPVLDK